MISLTHEEVVVLRLIKQDLVQQNPLVEALMKECYLARWEAWRIVHKLVNRRIIKEEGMSKKHAGSGKTIAVKTFALTELGESLFTSSSKGNPPFP